MDSRDHDHELPRISIPSMQVWLGVKSQYGKAMEAEVEKYARENNLSTAQRNATLEEARALCEKTFEIAQHNIRVNGRDFDSLQSHEQDAEPFDEALDRQIWSLASTRLQWHRKIAELRRETPVAVERSLQELFTDYEKLDREELDASDSDLEENSEGSEINVDGEVFGQITAATSELRQTIPSQHERSERSRTVEPSLKRLNLD
ncbi:hypothetical protein C8J57DRAFT_582209 [Mycena rebaudengoi]|nr:hypothetical protein C8J57DRAFT_582209 [Mycena rebaudengoi]